MGKLLTLTSGLTKPAEERINIRPTSELAAGPCSISKGGQPDVCRRRYHPFSNTHSCHQIYPRRGNNSRVSLLRTSALPTAVATSYRCVIFTVPSGGLGFQHAEKSPASYDARPYRHGLVKSTLKSRLNLSKQRLEKRRTEMEGKTRPNTPHDFRLHISWFKRENSTANKKPNTKNTPYQLPRRIRELAQIYVRKPPRAVQVGPIPSQATRRHQQQLPFAAGRLPRWGKHHQISRFYRDCTLDKERRLDQHEL